MIYTRVVKVTERATRQAFHKKGIGSFVKDEKRIQFSEDLLAEASDDLGHMTGSTREANKLIEQSTDIIQRSKDLQHKMRRPDLFPEFNKDRDRIRRRKSFRVLVDFTKKDKEDT